MELYLSKSKYCNAVQCPKMLWMKKNKPEEFDESVMNQVVLDNGSEVGDLAMGLFGPYVEVPYGDLGGMIEQTKVLLEAGTPIICEASFSYEGLFCSVDILKNLGDNKCELYEVKSSTSVKDIYHHDVAFQYYVLPALFPDDPALDYHNLEEIHHGGEASAAFHNMQYMPPDLLKTTRQNLLKYCELDTYAMVKIWERLNEVIR